VGNLYIRLSVVQGIQVASYAVAVDRVHLLAAVICRAIRVVVSGSRTKAALRLSDGDGLGLVARPVAVDGFGTAKRLSWLRRAENWLAPLVTMTVSWIAAGADLLGIPSSGDIWFGEAGAV
jgi:hypothetical protein